MTARTLGYSRDSQGQWQPILDQSGSILSQAFIMCVDCGRVIAGRGGPRIGSVCVSCHDRRQFEAFVRGSTRF